MTIRERIATLFNFQEKPKDLNTEIGVGADGLTKSFGEEESRTDNLKLEDYIKMQQNDGQVTALVKSVTLPIKSAEYTIEEDPEWNKEEESPELQFVKKNLLEPEYKGGMTTPMGHIISDMLRSITEGYRCYEKVYDIYEGKIRLKKLAIRPNNTISILTDEKGEYKGLRQKVSAKGKWYNVDIPAEKSLLVTFQKDKDWWYGESILKPVYYHYDKKHKLYFTHYVASELSAVKVRLVKEKSADPSYVAKLNAVVDKLGFKSRATYDPTKAEVEFADASNPAVMDGIMRMIDEQNAQMAKAIMAGFIESSTGKFGSKSMNEVTMDFFLMAINGIMKFIEEHINAYVIPDLIKYNFGTNNYPRFKFMTVDNKQVQFVYEVIKEMARTGQLPESVKTELIKKAGGQLDIEIDETQLQAPVEVKASEATHVHLEEQMPRALYPEEEKINLAEFQKAYAKSETEVLNALQRKAKAEKDQVVNKYLKAIKTKNPLNINRVTIELEEKGNYSAELERLFEQYFAFGKRQAADELDKPAKKVDAKDKKSISAIVGAIVAKQTADLMFRMSQVANDTMNDSEAGQIDAANRLSQEYDNFWERVLPTTASMTASRAINSGVMSGYAPYEELGEIIAYRYTAILDGNTTNYCRSLDGQVVSPTDTNFQRLSPPNHYNCRSRWVAVTDPNIPITGKPKDVPVQNSIDSFKDLSEAQIYDKMLEALNGK